MANIIEGRVWVPTHEEVDAEQDWIIQEIKRLGIDTLTTLAMEAALQRDRAYVPYSSYKVGVTILTKSGEIYRGNNVERAGYSETDHAEEAAITNAVVNGEVEKSGRKFLLALACSHQGDTAPCGRCRQIMVEHADNCLVLTVDTEGEIRRITSLKTLLPYAFTPTDLGIE